ncbi:MAG: OmpA family protein [Flavobacteriales bacterium]|nr:OmpA family protein [Flavobacteriales bacterium]
MRHLITLLLFVSLELMSFAGIQVQSFYFKKNSVELLSNSEIRLQEFMSTLGDTSIHIVELSCYAEGNTPDSNKRISDARIVRMIDMMGLKDKSITINSWGSERLNVRFTPLNWDRIDIYCQVDDLSDAFDYEKIPRPTITETETSKFEPVVLNILFEGGTSVIIEETLPDLHKLYATLKRNPKLTAHIRGHVCCENNKRLSRIRAKEIYKFLIEKGISKDRLSYKGYGNRIPLVYPERTAKDRSLNRRVDVVFEVN